MPRKVLMTRRHVNPIENAINAAVVWDHNLSKRFSHERVKINIVKFQTVATHAIKFLATRITYLRMT